MNNPLSTPTAEVRQEEASHERRSIALRQINLIKEMKNEKRLIREQKQSIADNDVRLNDAQTHAEEHLQAIKEAKAILKSQPETMALNITEKELNQQIKELGESLSNNLVAYMDETGSTFIEDENGKELKIKQKISVHSGQQRLF